MNFEKQETNFKVGDCVLISGINKIGIIISGEDKFNNLTVQIENLKLKVSKQKIKLANKTKNYVKNYICNNIFYNFDMRIQREIDLHGKTVDEAIYEVDTFIDFAISSNLSEIVIIHGKGTGTLKNGIHCHLKRHKFVKNFRLGYLGEGSNGVTIVTLKEI